MCLPNFKEFKQIDEKDAIIGHRIWRNSINENELVLRSEYLDHYWKSIEGPHEVREINSGIYAYNYNYNYNNYYNYYNNYYNYNYNYNNYYNYNYYGIVKQYGKVAIHLTGQRSEYAKIDTLFNIKLSDAKGPKEFLDWIELFNDKTDRIAEKYGCKVISYQDFIELKK